MFSLLRKTISLLLPMDVSKICNHIVFHIITYGCEIARTWILSRNIY